MIPVTNKITHPPNKTQPLSAVEILTTDRRWPSPVDQTDIFNLQRTRSTCATRSNHRCHMPQHIPTYPCISHTTIILSTARRPYDTSFRCRITKIPLLSPRVAFVVVAVQAVVTAIHQHFTTRLVDIDFVWTFVLFQSLD